MWSCPHPDKGSGGQRCGMGGAAGVAAVSMEHVRTVGLGGSCGLLRTIDESEGAGPPAMYHVHKSATSFLVKKKVRNAPLN
jgi:hypothetical protein